MVRTAFPPRAQIYYFRRIAALFLFDVSEGVSILGEVKVFSTHAMLWGRAISHRKITQGRGGGSESDAYLGNGRYIALRLLTRSPHDGVGSLGRVSGDSGSPRRTLPHPTPNRERQGETLGKRCSAEWPDLSRLRI